MERQFRLNWPIIIEEARRRRKAQGLTQQRLAALAGVSVPTLSRFEKGDTHIELFSAMQILEVLGMLDKRVFKFSANDQYIDSLREVVIFKGNDGRQTIICAVSREALMDCFAGQRGGDLLKIFVVHQAKIERVARQKYFAGQFEEDGSILIRTQDFM